MEAPTFDVSSIRILGLAAPSTLHRSRTEAERADLLSAMPVGAVMIPEDGERPAPPWTR